MLALTSTSSAQARVQAQTQCLSDPHAALAELQPAVKINLNTASESELTQLHGVGATLARRIVEYRLAHGHFTHVDQLTQVHGVGAAKLSKLKGVLSVE